MHTYGASRGISISAVEIVQQRDVIHVFFLHGPLENGVVHPSFVCATKHIYDLVALPGGCEDLKVIISLRKSKEEFRWTGDIELNCIGTT